MHALRLLAIDNAVAAKVNMTPFIFDYLHEIEIWLDMSISEIEEQPADEDIALYNAAIYVRGLESTEGLLSAIIITSHKGYYEVCFHRINKRRLEDAEVTVTKNSIIDLPEVLDNLYRNYRFGIVK